ncbi:MAG: trypsin-like serine protease [Pseudomonadota bacterium]
MAPIALTTFGFTRRGSVIARAAARLVRIDLGVRARTARLVGGALLGAAACAGPAAAQPDGVAYADPPLAHRFGETRPASRGLLADAEAWVCGAPSAYDYTPYGGAYAGGGRYNPGSVDAAAPWAAKLEIVEERFADGGMTVSNCSAAAVAPGWLVTAAHCVGQERWVRVEATLGARDAQAPSAMKRSAALALCHTKFNPHDLSYDVALIKLDSPLPPEFPTLRLATSAEADRLTPGAAALSAGWGRISSSEISQVLRTADVRVVDPSRRSDGMIVAAPERNEHSLCVGESGAPLVADVGAGAALFGVFSSVDAYYNPDTGEMIELCEGFEARSYFTPLRGLQRWVRRAIAACEAAPQRCGFL